MMDDEAFKSTMQRLSGFLVLSVTVGALYSLLHSLPHSLLLAQAAETWVEVVVSPSGERVLVDRDSIQRSEPKVSYWEYRDLRQSRNTVREMVGEQPVYGMMMYRVVDCTAKVGRIERLVIFNQDREVIRRVNYEESNGVDLPIQGSQAEAVLQFVCEPPAPTS